MYAVFRLKERKRTERTRKKKWKEWRKKEERKRETNIIYQNRRMTA